LQKPTWKAASQKAKADLKANALFLL
jgi:hypothetical protein